MATLPESIDYTATADPPGAPGPRWRIVAGFAPKAHEAAAEHTSVEVPLELLLRMLGQLNLEGAVVDGGSVHGGEDVQRS